MHTMTVTDRKAEVTVLYPALVLQVELLSGGELTHGSARTLSDRNWGLEMEVVEEVAYFRTVGEVGDRVASVAPPPQIPRGVATNLGPGCEDVIKASRGRRVRLRQSAVHDILLGARVALLEIFCGEME